MRCNWKFQKKTTTNETWSTTTTTKKLNVFELIRFSCENGFGSKYWRFWAIICITTSKSCLWNIVFHLAWQLFHHIPKALFLQHNGAFCLNVKAFIWLVTVRFSFIVGIRWLKLIYFIGTFYWFIFILVWLERLNSSYKQFKQRENLNFF